jgi:hypothetical protein
MFTALLLSYDLSVPAAVRWLGGMHTGAHRDHATILSTHAAAGVDQDILRDLRRIYLFGAPAYINAESTEDNFRNYFRYGNHKTVLEDIPKTMKAMSKDVHRGYNIVLSPRLSFLIPHLHTHYSHCSAVVKAAFPTLCIGALDLCQTQKGKTHRHCSG